MTDRPEPCSALPLHCHAAAACGAVRCLHAGWRWRSAGGVPQLQLHYALRAAPGVLRLPAPRPPAFADGLWRHTCFEAFIGTAQGGAYHEFNFSPSGEWAAYGFSAPRERDTRADARLHGQAPLTCWTQDEAAGVLSLAASLPLDALPARLPGSGWRLGLTAVIEMQDGGLSHWALHHPAGRPDFHHPDGWTVCLPAPTV